MFLNPEKQFSILVVDDGVENIDVLKETLKHNYIVRPALNGELALKIAAANPNPDLILLDIMMPGMDGYEVMRRLQENEATRTIPVIFVTAMADMERELQGLLSGAVDYITKPFNPPVVRARVQTHLALKQAKETLAEKNFTLLRERELVENIITRMRTSRSFDDRYLRYQISSVDRTNGDILLSSFTPENKQWVLVGDFTGHGLPAAVAAPLLSYVFYTQAHAGRHVEEALLEINSVLYNQLPVDVFMTASMVEVSEDRSSIKIWNFGMPQCLLIENGTIQARITSKSLPLGIAEISDVQDACELIYPGKNSRLYIFSDGIPETTDRQGQIYGYPRIEAFLSNLASDGRPLNALLHELERYKGDADFCDDITLVEIQL
jgi:CheY-like chemotaxis protein